MNKRNVLYTLTGCMLMVGLLAGCTKSRDQVQAPAGPVAAAQGPGAVVAPTEVTNTLITTFGAHSAGNWKVQLPEDQRTLEVGWQGSSQKPSTWRAQTGWFVFVENDHRVWAYDGDRGLLLFEHTGTADRGESSVSGPSNFGSPVPQPVLTRLSEGARKAIRQ